MQQRNLILEALKARAGEIVAITGGNQDELTLKLVHTFGYDRVDFSGGAGRQRELNFTSRAFDPAKTQPIRPAAA